jgi:hypothetical protein
MAAHVFMGAPYRLKVRFRDKRAPGNTDRECPAALFGHPDRSDKCLL